MARAEFNVKVLTITEDELRRIIREEVRKIVPQHYAPLPIPYVNPTPYQPPQIWCDTTKATNDTNVTVSNA